MEIPVKEKEIYANAAFLDQVSIAFIVCTVWSLHHNQGLGALVWYAFANIVSIGSGYYISKMKEAGPDYNRSVHKWHVVALNGVVGLTVIGWGLYYRYFTVLLITLLVYLCAYGISYWSRLIAPHSMLARFRSAVLRMLIAVNIGSMISLYATIIIAVCSIPILFITWRHLHKEMKKLELEYR